MAQNLPADDVSYAALATRLFHGFGVGEGQLPDGFIQELNLDGREVFSEITDTGRWDIHWFTVYRFPDGSLVGIEHSEGATENQENEGITDVYVVEARNVLHTEYHKVG